MERNVPLLAMHRSQSALIPRLQKLRKWLEYGTSFCFEVIWRGWRRICECPWPR